MWYEGICSMVKNGTGLIIRTGENYRGETMEITGSDADKIIKILRKAVPEADYSDVDIFFRLDGIMHIDLGYVVELEYDLIHNLHRHKIHDEGIVDSWTDWEEFQF